MLQARKGNVNTQSIARDEWQILSPPHSSSLLMSLNSGKPLIERDQAIKGTYAWETSSDLESENFHDALQVSATMFPSHLNTMVQMPSHQSLGGQQNLVNAATHLMEVSQGGGLWSTPRGPLETPLYSTSSSISER